jgi:hypothetical protein
MPGITTSKTTQSKDAVPNSFRALGPSAAVLTRKPAISRAAPINSRVPGSSSTIKTAAGAGADRPAVSSVVIIA